MVGIITGIANAFSPFLDLHGCGWSEKSTDINSHVENRKGRVALVCQFGIIIKVTDHYLKITLEKTCSQRNQYQGSQHSGKADCISSKRNGEEQITNEHNNDTNGHHLTIAELVSQDTTYQRKEIDKSEETTVNETGSTRVKTEVCS